jgi:hypothetical protein
MKLHKLALFLPFLFAVACATQPSIPTPKLTVGFDMNQDTAVKWHMGYVDGKANGFVCEFVPEGQSVNAWTELVTNIVAFDETDPILLNTVKAWEDKIAKADSSASFKNTPLKDGSYLAEYSAPNGNEFGIYHFFRGPDATYRMGYATRMSPDKDARLDLWRKIILEARLEPNPLYRGSR